MRWDQNTSLSGVIRKLRSAGEGSRDLDEMVGRALGWTLRPVSEHIEEDWFDPRGVRAHFVPGFSKSIDAAASLVPNGWIWDVTSTGTSWVMHDLTDGNGHHISTRGATPALALCIAALEALEAA